MIAEISVSELEQLIAAGAKVIDVRESDEFAAGHVPTAISIPLSTVQNRVDEFRYEGSVYVIVKQVRAVCVHVNIWQISTSTIL